MITGAGNDGNNIDDSDSFPSKYYENGGKAVFTEHIVFAPVTQLLVVHAADVDGDDDQDVVRQ